MLDIILWLLIIIAIVVILWIILRKFAVLASVDVDSIASERQARVKQMMLANKLKRRTTDWLSNLAKLARPIHLTGSRLFFFLQSKLVKMRDQYSEPADVTTEDAEKKINLLLIEAAELERQDDLAAAESRYIQVIGLDSKNIKAFRCLGDLYLNRQNYQEAEQTFEHLLKLKISTKLGQADGKFKDSELAQIYFALAQAAYNLEHYNQAVAQLKKALRIEKNNPRYLDKLIEVAILNKDKITAYEAYKTLAKINPENQKLAQLQELINGL